MKSFSRIVFFLILTLAFLAPSNSVLAATYTVCASGCDYTTIQAAINAAASGDTIQVGAGTYNENVVIDKNNISLIGAVALNPNVAPNPATHTIIDSGAPASVNSPVITINSGVTGVTIRNLRVQNFSSNSGIYGVLGNNNLTIENIHVYSNNTANSVSGGGIYLSGPISNVLINNVDSQLNRSRGIVIWDGFKQNITITNNYVANNNCCGIELQDGTASGVTITGNTVINNGDNGIGVVGLTSGAGANLISNNTLTNNGRFGIEIKLPDGTGATSGDGSIVVENNTVTLNTPSADLRDFAGIAVFRRAYVPGYNNVDIPSGVIVRNNSVSGYAQNNVGSNSTGFGIVVEGYKTQVLNNTLTGNEVGVQVQAGHLPYTADTGTDGDQSDLADDYFGRGNSPVACAKVEGNNYTSNGLDYRVVGSGASDAATILNQTQSSYHCSIQEAIDFAAAGDTIQVPAGTYAEELEIDKGLTLLGPNASINPNTGSRVAEAVIYPTTANNLDPSAACNTMAYLSVSDITIKGFTFDGDNPGLTSGIMINGADVNACEILAGYEGMANIILENNILKRSTYTGVDFYNYINDAATSGNYIRYNRFEDIGESTYDWGIGILVYNNFYADITDNVLNNVRTGIQTGNYYFANPGSTGRISDNAINAWRMGIFHNLWYSNASSITISNNTITAVDSADSNKWNGMLISSFQNAVDTTISNNVINIGAITQNPAAGYVVWNTPTSATITISGGSVTGGNYGVWVNNYEGYASDAANTSAEVDGVTITGASMAGVYVLDSPSNTNSSTVQATIKNTTIVNSGKGIQIANTDASAEVRNSTIANNANEGIYNDASSLIVNSSTLSANGAGNLYNNAGSVSVTNTILANSASPDVDCFSTNSLVVNANNLMETNSGCGTPALTVDPLLGPLSNNGGFTQTMALTLGSPTIGAGNNSTCELFDQRGVARPQGIVCDIGSYESNSLAPLPTDWVGSVLVDSDKNLVTVSRPHIGLEVASYDGFTSGSLTAFVPMLFKDAFGGSYDSALYIQNVSASSATITLQYYDNSGTLNCTKSDTLSALASKGYWVPTATCDTGSLPAGWVGGVKVTSDQPIVTIGRPHVGSEVMTYNGFSAGSTSAYLPMLFKDAFGGSYDAAFYLQNVSASSATITLQYYDNSGTLNCTKSDTLSALASKGYWVPTATCDTGSLPAGWVGGVKVTSDQPIVTIGRPHIDAQVTAYNGFSAGSTSAYLPMLFKDAFGGSYDAAFYLQNTQASTANVTIKYYDDAGALQCIKSDTIAPLASKGYWAPSATCDTGSLPDGWIGSVEVASDQPIITVGRPHIGVQVTTYNGFSAGASTAFLPMLFKDAFGGSYNSAFYLQNTESSAANVTIQFYDSTGALTCSRTDTIPPRATLGFWAPSLTCYP